MEREPSKHFQIVKVDAALFEKHQRAILDLEKDLIVNSSSAYLIDEEDELDFMMDAFKKGGFGYLIMEGEEVIGFLVAGPLDDGSDLPPSITQHFPVKKCLHIKVMYIKPTGQGLGSALMQQLTEEIDRDQWEYLFVRTWVDPPNEGAINFYTNKASFKIVPDTAVQATKTKVDSSGTFQIQRQYFARRVS